MWRTRIRKAPESQHGKQAMKNYLEQNNHLCHGLTAGRPLQVYVLNACPPALSQEDVELLAGRTWLVEAHYFL